MKKDIRNYQGRSKEQVESNYKVLGISIIGLFIIFTYLLIDAHLFAKDTYHPDNDPNVLHWEIIRDSMHVYTKHDSIIDQRERWEYIRSLDHDSLWE